MLAAASGERAISSRSDPGTVTGISSLIAARRRRLARLRLTAFPTANPALTPTCVSEPSDLSTYKTTSGWAYDLPERRTLLISVDRVRRKLRFTCACRLQSRSPTPSPLKSYQRTCLTCWLLRTVRRMRPLSRRRFSTIAAVCGGHALAETMHTHAPPDLGLISTLGHSQTPNKRIKTPNGGFPPGFSSWSRQLHGMWTVGNYNRGG